MNVDVIEAIKKANSRFYTALGNANIELMDSVWLHSENTTCLHPGWTLLHGWDNVRASWEGIFRNQGAFRVWPSDVNVFVADNVAWVLCSENIDVGRQGDKVGLMVQTQATNIFQLDGNSWRMVHHHASQKNQTPPGTSPNLRPTISAN